jgi:ABC-type oligopeptide transport system ATPase subunit
MLELKGIKKDYPAGNGKVAALKGIDLQFRRSEFVAVLGPSGCGKTTMLNIIGGLDGYTEGDLVINGISTKKYKDRDWDAYRNHSIGRFDVRSAEASRVDTTPTPKHVRLGKPSTAERTLALASMLSRSANA